jgi:uncharacterized protein YsxB (DUF464 family)
MIEIVFDGNNNELEIMGHGGNNDGSYDISCCVVSTLACTLAETIAEHITDFDEKNGYMYIKAQESAKTRHCFKLTETGLKRAAEIYPNNIKFIEKNCKIEQKSC